MESNAVNKNSRQKYGGG